MTDEEILEKAQLKIIALYDDGINKGIKEPLVSLIVKDDDRIELQVYDRKELLRKLGNPKSLDGLTECRPGYLWCVIARQTSVVPYKMLIVRNKKSIGQC